MLLLRRYLAHSVDVDMQRHTQHCQTSSPNRNSIESTQISGRIDTMLEAVFFGRLITIFKKSKLKYFCDKLSEKIAYCHRIETAIK